MKLISMDSVEITSGYLYAKQELNRNTTINAVYDRFYETGRIGAFDFSYDENDPSSVKPHIFWDSDVAKWIEGVANITKKYPSPELEAKVDALVEKIKKNQGADGYFNIYYTVVEPDMRFTNRRRHELYCAGHLMEAAIEYHRATGKRDFLDCMEKYAEYIYRVFVEEKSSRFTTPGHEEIELALVKMYRYTGNKKYLELAKFFIDMRGVAEEENMEPHYQTHKPVREQDEAVGHAVRAMYLYTGMAMVAKETNDEELSEVCRKLWENVVYKKMYVTGGLGSTFAGEAFTRAYDLPNDTSYAETCAAIGLVFFSNAMLEMNNNSRYADVIERAIYNGVLSGLSQSGDAFFYENPLEINKSEHVTFRKLSRRFPITQRVKVFDVSCCPPNLNRFLSSLGNYIYGEEGDTLYVNQYISSTFDGESVGCKQQTNYPNDGEVCVSVTGAKKVALRIPAWCDSFTLNKPYVVENGYAVIENDGTKICLSLDMTAKLIYANPLVRADAGKVCVTRGPIVYCAESIDNDGELYRFVISQNAKITEKFDENIGLVTLRILCEKRIPFDGLYSTSMPMTESAVLNLIPYNYFANRGESDMAVWFCTALI